MFCEMCYVTDKVYNIYPVLIDGEMETEMCKACIKILRSETTVEIIKDGK